MRKILCLLILFGAFSASAQRFVRYFDTVTDMAASNPADPNVYVVVGGSVSFNDNQAARWKWVTGSVDPADGNTVVSTWAGGWPGKPSGRWKKINEASGIVIDTSGFITNYNVVVVNDKASLQNINVTNNIAVALVKGKYGMNDGWEGQFTFNAASTAVADDAFYVAPNTGVGMWERQTPNPLREIPATWFDPNLTNGVIQAAINYAASLSTNAVPGREVLLPPKFIELNGNTGLNMSNNVTLVGQNGTVLATSAGTVAGYQMIRANGVTNWGVKNLQLIGLASVGGYGIFVTNSSVGVWGGITFATNFTTAPVWITNSSRIIPFDDKWTVNSVRAYGAGANGRDDTIPFQMAFANLDTNSEEIVYAPPGEYYANIIMAKEGAVLRGAGRNLTRLFSYNTNSPTVTMGLDDGEFYRNMRVEHLSIGAPQQTGGIVRPTVCGLRVQGGASKGTVFDCYVGNIQGNLVEVLGGTSTFHGLGTDVTTAEISFFRIINSMLEYARGGNCLYMNTGPSDRSTQLYIDHTDLFLSPVDGSKMAHLNGGALLIDNSYWQGSGTMGVTNYGVWITNRIARIVAHNWNVDSPGVSIEYGFDVPQPPYTYLTPQGVGITGDDIFIGGSVRYKGSTNMVDLSGYDSFRALPLNTQEAVFLNLYFGSSTYLGTNWASKGFTLDRRIYGSGDSNLTMQTGPLLLTTPTLRVVGEEDLGGPLVTGGGLTVTNTGNLNVNFSSPSFDLLNLQSLGSNWWSIVKHGNQDFDIYRYDQQSMTNLQILVIAQPNTGDTITFTTVGPVQTTNYDFETVTNIDLRIWTNTASTNIPLFSAGPGGATNFIPIGTDMADSREWLFQYLHTFANTNCENVAVRRGTTNDVLMQSDGLFTIDTVVSGAWGTVNALSNTVAGFASVDFDIAHATGETHLHRNTLVYDSFQVVSPDHRTNNLYVNRTNGVVTLAQGLADIDIKSVHTTVTNYPALNTDFMIRVDTSLGNRQVTLPAAPRDGKIFVIKKVTGDANTMEVLGNTHTIDGAASVITAGTSLTAYRLYYTGSEWDLQ